MPQTSDAVLSIINKWFPLDRRETPHWSALKLLFAKGWTERGGMLTPPTPSYYGPREDYVLLKYLVEEWDYDYQTAPIIEVK